MKRFTYCTTLMASVLLLGGCRSQKATVAGRFVGSEAAEIYLEQVTPLSQTVIDTARLDDAGNYRFRLNKAAETPTLYNLVYNGERIPLLIAGGDRLTVGAVGSPVRNYTVEGSEETELLRQFYQAYVIGAQQLEEIASQLAQAGLTDDQRRELAKSYTAEYYRIRREQLRFIVENKSSLAAVYALYQRLPGDTHLFNGDSDVVYFRTVADAVGQRYPQTPYLQPLLGEIARMDARISLTSQVTETGYPDLDMQDIYGKRVKLSSLTGKVVLLDFWSAEVGNSNTLNAELKETYKKYASAPTPFEVYQVALDTSKPAWITAVQEQQLPWISVSDLRGRSSAAVGLYNLQKLPANFLIDKEGTIVAKDIYGKSLEQKLDQLTK
ncbi:MAG: TlpA family protein disulfide reductase [Alistipes sp.]|nr:TlpA family protein disulfide reductase [Alistipes sp.]